jgi:hypothetical protein
MCDTDRAEDAVANSPTWRMNAQMGGPEAIIYADFEYVDPHWDERDRPDSTVEKPEASGPLSFSSLASYMAFRDFWIEGGGEVCES